MNYEAVFFDCDGTLIDTNDIKASAAAQLFAALGPEVETEIYHHFIATGGVSRFEKFRYYYRTFLGKEASEKDLRNLHRRFSTLVKPQMLKAPFINGALETLTQLQKQKIPAFIVTGTPDEEINQVITSMGHAPLFKEICGTPPEKKEILHNLINKYGFTPEWTLFVGDAPADLEAAKANHIPFLGIVLNGNASPFGPTVLTTSILSLPPYAS